MLEWTDSQFLLSSLWSRVEVLLWELSSENWYSVKFSIILTGIALECCVSVAPSLYHSILYSLNASLSLSLALSLSLSLSLALRVSVVLNAHIWLNVQNVCANGVQKQLFRNVYYIQRFIAANIQLKTTTLHNWRPIILIIWLNNWLTHNWNQLKWCLIRSGVEVMWLSQSVVQQLNSSLLWSMSSLLSRWCRRRHRCLTRYHFGY